VVVDDPWVPRTESRVRGEGHFGGGKGEGSLSVVKGPGRGGLVV